MPNDTDINLNTCLAVCGTGLVLYGTILLRRRLALRALEKTGTRLQQTKVSANAMPFTQVRPEQTLEEAKWKILFTSENGSRAIHLDLGPNVVYPDHKHGSNEWCFVAAGSIHDQHGWHHKDSFFYNYIGSHHHDIYTGLEGVSLRVVKEKGDNTPLESTCGCYIPSDKDIDQ